MKLKLTEKKIEEGEGEKTSLKDEASRLNNLLMGKLDQLQQTVDLEIAQEFIRDHSEGQNFSNKSDESAAMRLGDMAIDNKVRLIDILYVAGMTNPNFYRTKFTKD